MKNDKIYTVCDLHPAYCYCKRLMLKTSCQEIEEKGSKQNGCQ